MVVDSSAVFAIIFGEPERHSFVAVLAAADRRLISAATAVECAAVLEGRRPGADPMVALSLVFQDLGLEVAPLDDAQWRAAADSLIRFGKGRHPARLNLGGSFAYALAKVTGEPLLYKGNDFPQTDIEPVTA